MAAMGETVLSTLLLEGTKLRLAEPHIYTVLSDTEVASTYDTQFGYIYDLVACNPIYNRVIWGYSVSMFASIAHDALRSSNEGNVLDLGCGSLAFTAKEYTQYSERPVVLLDQSLKMLRIAKSRLIRINRVVPDNMVFLHANALQLPFHKESFKTVIAENLLHCLDDTKSLLKGLISVLSGNGKIYFTTLVEGNRLADRYLRALANGGKLVYRSIDEHRETFDQLGISVRWDVDGNMASFFYGD